MIIKYTIDLKQFNNGESDRITFPTFEQCMMYGFHKLKGAIKNGTALIHAILIEDSKGRKVVIHPAIGELDFSASIVLPSLTVKFKTSPDNGEARFVL